MSTALVELKDRAFATSLIHEGRAAIGMARDGIRSARSRRARASGDPRGKNVLILPGLMGPQIAYFPFARWIREEVGGIRVARVANFGFLNLPSWKRQQRILFEEARLFRKRYGSIDVVIGHSLGGLEAIALLALYPEIWRVITIASPFNFGKPWRLIEIGSLLIAVPESMRREILKKIVDGARGHEHKIVTVSSAHDKLCPPEQAAFPLRGVRNVVIKDAQVIAWAEAHGTLREEQIWHTHTGLPNSPYVREEILRGLLES